MFHSVSKLSLFTTGYRRRSLFIALSACFLFCLASYLTPGKRSLARNVSAAQPRAVLAQPSQGLCPNYPSTDGCLSSYISNYLPAMYTDAANCNLLQSNVNLEMTDYGAIYLDADGGCPDAALTSLTTKLQFIIDFSNNGGSLPDSPPNGRTDGRSRVPPFQQWLSGAVVTNLFAAAIRLMDRGYDPSDYLLTQAESLYSQIQVPQDNCGSAGDTCFDDYAVTASGFAWIAAYEAARGRNYNVPFYANQAKDWIAQSLTPMSELGPEGKKGAICFYKGGTDCNGTWTDWSNGTAQIIGAEHNQENPAYGIGLMTSIAAAMKGLELANSPYSLTSNQRTIAAALFKHGQNKTASADGSSFTNDCIDFTNPSGPRVNCGDRFIGYLPTDFPVKRFYIANGVQLDTCGTQFQFDSYVDGRSESSGTPQDRTNFWGTGRRVIYSILAARLWPPIPPSCGGALESVDCANGISGWAWDMNNPNSVVPVSLYIDSTRVSVSAGFYRPDLMCKGNQNHGFSQPISMNLRDGQPHTIRAFASNGIELTGSPRTLTCPSIYEGYNDGADCNSIWGWAWTPGNPNAVVSVDIYEVTSTGSLSFLGSTQANLFRQDLLTANRGNGYHAFTFNIPASLRDGRAHTLKARFGGTTADLSWTPRTITCSAAHAYEGYNDGADCNTIWGWAWDQNYPNSPINVDLFAMNVWGGLDYIGTTQAGYFRQDLLNAGKGNGYHAFVYAVPAYLKDGYSHTIVVTYGGTYSYLYWTSRSMTCTQ